MEVKVVLLQVQLQNLAQEVKIQQEKATEQVGLELVLECMVVVSTYIKKTMRS